MQSPLFLESEGEQFAVFFENTGSPDHQMSWSGQVYPIIIFDTGFKKFAYYNNRRSDPEDDKEQARCFFQFSYCWRGVWEGRFYPQQEEYWGEDVLSLSNLWDQIEKILQDKIKSDNPEYKHFD